VKRDGKSLLEWIRIHSLKGLPGLAGPELRFSRTPTASVLCNDACLRLPARNTYVTNNPSDWLMYLRYINGYAAALKKKNDFFRIAEFDYNAIL
jgi:hypothetical protein